MCSLSQHTIADWAIVFPCPLDVNCQYFSVVLEFCHLLSGLKLDFQRGNQPSCPIVSVNILSRFKIYFGYLASYVHLKFHIHDADLHCHPSVSPTQLLENRVFMAITFCAEAWSSDTLRTKIQFLRYWEFIPSLNRKNSSYILFRSEIAAYCILHTKPHVCQPQKSVLWLDNAWTSEKLRLFCWKW
jgi:hypothetical protein